MTTTQHLMLQPAVLYLIFLELPQADLLLAQRVCKTWQATIQDFAVLQKALFLRPDFSAKRHGEVEVNPLLVRHFRGFFLVESANDSVLGPFRNTLWSAEEEKPNPDERKLRAYARKEASWRRMLLSRPTPSLLQKFNGYSGMLGYGGVYTKLSFERDSQASEVIRRSQLTFGLIYDLAHGFVFPSWDDRTDISATMVIVGAPDNAYCAGDSAVADAEVTLSQNGMACMLQEWRRQYADAFPDFAPPGSVLLRFDTINSCIVDSPGPSHYTADYLRSEGAESESVGEIEWEATSQYHLSD